jgi:hypothetical protein
MPGAGRQSARQSLAEIVHPLGDRGEQCLGLGPAARGELKTLARAIRLTRKAVVTAPTKLEQMGCQLGAHRHGELGRGGWRRRPQVGGMVDQRRIRLMADRRDQRDGRLGDGANDVFLIERPQILDRPTSARNDQQVGTGRDRREPADRVGDPGRGALALHRHRPQDDVRREASLEAVKNVANHRAGR